MGQAFAIPTTLDYKEYTSDDNRFTIEYPGNWLKGADGLGHIDSEIAFSDKADWNVMAQVFFNDGDTPDDRTDYQVLKQLVYNDSEVCEDTTFALDDRICYDYEKIDSYTMEAFNGNKMYFVKSSYTLEFDDPSYPGEYPMISAFGLVYGKDGSWEINIESDDFAFAKNSDDIIHMMKSFSLESQSQPTSTETVSKEPIPSKEPTVSNTPSKVAVPAWTKNIFLWYGEDKVSDDELINALKFLIEEKILSVPTGSPSVIKDTTPNNPLYKTYTNEKYDLTLQYPVDWSISQLGTGDAEIAKLVKIWNAGGWAKSSNAVVGPVDMWVELWHYFSETRAETYYGSSGTVKVGWNNWCSSKTFNNDGYICSDIKTDLKTISKYGNYLYYVLSTYTLEYADGEITKKTDLDVTATNIDSSWVISTITLAEDWKIYKDDIYSIIDSIQSTSTHTSSNENGVLRLKSNVYELPQRGASNLTYSSNIDLFGEFSKETKGSIILKVTKPDGKIAQEDIRMSRNVNSFHYQYVIKSDFPTGEYKITVSAETSGIQLEPLSFTVIAANPENQICGGAGWENLEKYGGGVPASGFCRTINTPVLEKQVETKEIPAWSKNIFLWYGQGQVSEDEIVNALQFLINENILSIENRK